MSTADDADGVFSDISHEVISIPFIFLIVSLLLSKVHSWIGKNKSKNKTKTQNVVLELKKGKEKQKGDEEWGWKALSGGTGMRGCKR